jgi:hypothetical protein
MQAAENRASQGGKSANEGVYFLYVTEICRCSQRRKQNYTVILRLRDFFDGLRYRKRIPGFFMTMARYAAEIRLIPFR